MSYNKQNFINGQKLTAEHINHIENGIAQNATDINILATDVANTKKSLKVLLLSNSFGQDSFSYVPSTINRLVGDKVDITVGMLYIGGCSLERHWSEINGKTSAYTYYEATNNQAWINGGSSNALSKLQKENWDLFVFNQLSTATVDEKTFSPYLNNIINWVATNANKPLKIGMFFGGTYPSGNLTVDTMYDQSVPVLKNVLEDYPIEIFFPNGTAIQNARTNNTLKNLGTTGNLLYDNLHAQEGLPCLIEAYTVALGLLEILGLSSKSILGDKPTITDNWTTSMNIPGKHGSVVGMTNSNIVLAQKSAIMAHKKPFEVSIIE